ncbi:MAG: RNA methyltransferase [Calditrichaeota bacterium]|nr:RNA methyltransferase [Calditrichota bacterium]
MVTERRLARFQRVARARLGNLIVVEDRVEDPHNLSATLRSCELLGVQRVLILDPDRVFSVSPRVAVDAHRWLTLERFRDYEAGLARLQELTSKIYVTAFTPDAYSIHELFPLFDFPFWWPPAPDRNLGEAAEFSKPDLPPPPTPNPDELFALVFGNEIYGVSEQLASLGTANFYVPTPGFVQSFNISVAVGVVLYHVTSWIRSRLGREGTLSEEEQEALVRLWLSPKK